MTTEVQKPLIDQIREFVGPEAFAQHDGWWRTQARERSEIIQGLLKQAEERRRGSRRINNPGGWLFNSLNREIEAKK